MNDCPFRTCRSMWCEDCEIVDYKSCDSYKQKYKQQQEVIELCKKEREQVEQCGRRKKMNEINTVTVRWHDGYLEEFECTEVRFGSDLLWLRLKDGKNRHIPLRSVRWFGMTKESHQRMDGERE